MKYWIAYYDSFFFAPLLTISFTLLTFSEEHYNLSFLLWPWKMASFMYSL